MKFLGSVDMVVIEIQNQQLMDYRMFKRCISFYMKCCMLVVIESMLLLATPPTFP